MFYFLFLFALVFADDKALQPQIIGNKTSIKHIQPVSKAKNLLENVVSDPKKFVEEVAKLDPVALRTIITLLRDLLDTSEARETELNSGVTDANAAVTAASNAVATADDNLDDADADVKAAEAALKKAREDAETAINAAKGVLAEKEAEKVTAQGVLNNAKSDHSNKVNDLADAESALNGEAEGLDHEQKVIREVIAILEGLHGDASTRIEEQYWDLDGGVTISDGLAAASESAVTGAMTSKTSYSRPMEVSWTSKMVDTRGDECVVMDVFPHADTKHSGYSIGYGWWGTKLGYSVDDDLTDAHQNPGTDGDISVNHVYKLVLTDSEVIWYADDVEFHRVSDTQYTSGKIRVGRSCRGWETSDITVTPL